MSKDSREQTKNLQKHFLQTCQKRLQQFSSQLQKVLISTILESKDHKAMQNKLKNIQQLDRTSYGLLQMISNNLTECIRRQYQMQGIAGYNKCYVMFERLMNWEFRKIGKGLQYDDHVQIGIKDSIDSKKYHQNYPHFFKQ